MEPQEKRRKMSCQEECRNPNHGRKTLAILDDFRKDEHLCDFYIRVGDKVLPVHRNVVAATSPYFKDLINKSLCGKAETDIAEITNASFLAVKHCIEYMYRGTTMVNIEVADDVLKAAKLMQLQGLIELWFKHFCSILNVRNCWEIRRLADEYEHKRTRKTVDILISNNIGDVCNHQSFFSISYNDFIKYIEKSTHALTTWKATSLWINHDKSNRIDNLPNIMKKLPLHQLGLVDLEAMINDILVRSFNRCVEIVAKQILDKVITKEGNFDVKDLSVLNRISQVFNDTEFSAIVHQKILDELPTLTNKQEFVKFSLQDIKSLLRYVNINDTSEIHVWKAICTWMKSNPNRENDYIEILGSIRLSRFSTQFIQDVIRNDQIVKKNAKCLNLVLDALFVRVSSGVEKVKNKTGKVTMSANHQNKPPAHPFSRVSSSSISNISLPPQTSPAKDIAQQSGRPTEFMKFSSETGTSIRSTPSATNENDAIAVIDTSWENILTFLPSSERWYKLSNIQSKTQSLLTNAAWFQAAVIDNIIYILTPKLFFSFDVKNTSWNILKSPLFAHDEYSKSVEFQRKLFIVGQFSEYYDPLKDIWTAARLPDHLTIKFCVASTPTKLYKIGGTLKTMATSWVYSWESDFKEASHSRMNIPRKNASAASSGEDLYVMGGLSATDQALSSSECYTHITDTWFLLSNMNGPRSTSHSCSLSGEIYVVGGRSIEKYNKKNSKWDIIGTFEYSVDKFTAVRITIT